MLTPCPAETTAGCGGVFRLEFLLSQPPEADVPCQECGHRYQVAELLTGLRQAGPGTAAGISDAALREALDLAIASLRRDIGDLKQDVHAAAAANADAMRRLLTVVSTEVPDCPRLFTRVRTPGKGIDKLDPRLRHYRLTLSCEEPGHWHPHTAELSRRAYGRVVPGGRPLRAAGAADPARGRPSGRSGGGPRLHEGPGGPSRDGARPRTQALLDDLPPLPGDDADWAGTPDGQPGLVAATGASLRGLRHLLNDDLDPGRQYGGLTRFLTAAGDYIWVCPDHAAAYNPGPPTI